MTAMHVEKSDDEHGARDVPLAYRKNSSPPSDAQTEDLDPYYQQTVDFGGREYQRYAIENGAYFVPVDEVECTGSWRAGERRVEHGKMKRGEC